MTVAIASMVPNTQSSVRRRRIYKGRSKLGCRNCKQKHIRCDEAQPHCKNCFKSGLKCDGPIPPPPATTPSPSSTASSPATGSQAETEPFQLFVTEIAPFSSGFQTSNFYADSVCHLAKYNPGIYNAVMALACLWEIPQAQILVVSNVPSHFYVCPEYHKAIEWYDRSVSLSMRDIPANDSGTIVESLVLTILYMHIEFRLGHRNNVENLARTAFAVVDSFRDTLLFANDSRVSNTLLHLFRFPVVQPIDCTTIPRGYRNTAIEVALANTADLEDPNQFMLEFELINICWDLDDLVDGFPSPIGGDPVQRLGDWHQKYTLHRASANQHWLLDLLYHTCRVRWHAHLYGLYSQRQRLEEHLKHILDITHRLALFSNTTSASLATPIINSFVIPLCIFVAWNWRDDNSFARINAILSKLGSASKFAHTAATYIETLVTADYREGTALELRLLGAQPRALQRWHIQECCWDMLKHDVKGRK